VQDLGVLMTSWQATTFLIGGYFTENDQNPVLTVTDGLFWLRQSVQGNSMVRKLEIMKMRGQCTLPGLHTFRISTAGIHVFAPPQLAAGCGNAIGGAPRRSPADGVPGLDEMMGGGLPRGYSLLVAGPSGSGKSILAAAFLAEGARGGETGVIAAFEQRPNHSRGRAMSELIETAGSAWSTRAQPTVGRRDCDAADHRNPPDQGDAESSSIRSPASNSPWRPPSATTSVNRCRAWCRRWPAPASRC
jgi:circadian clock protein KaiC